MDTLFTKLKNMDRRILYFVVFLSITLPLIPGFDFLKSSFSVTKETQMVFDYIDELNPGDAIYVDFAFDPTSQAELLPMAEGVIKHAFKKNLKVLIYNQTITSVALAQDMIKKIKSEPEFAEKKETEDYVHLNYLPLSVDLILFSMQTDVKNTFKKEGKIFEGVRTLRDIKFIVCLAGSAAGEEYATYQRRFGYKTTSGVTAVMAPGMIPHVQAGRAVGFLNGLRGAAEYEKLVGYRGIATAGMTSLTYSHLVILFFIVLGNVIFFYERSQRKRRG